MPMLATSSLFSVSFETKEAARYIFQEGGGFVKIYKERTNAAAAKGF